MEYVIISVISIIVGCLAGWKAHEMMILHIIESNPDIIEEACTVVRKMRADEAANSTGDASFTIKTDTGETITAHGVELLIEQVSGVMYAYEKVSGNFIAQADSIERLMETAHERFPGKTFFGEIPEQEASN